MGRRKRNGMRVIDEEDYDFVDRRSEMTKKIKTAYKKIEKKVTDIDAQIKTEISKISFDYRVIGANMKATLEDKLGTQLRQYIDCDDEKELEFYQSKLTNEIDEMIASASSGTSRPTNPTPGFDVARMANNIGSPVDEVIQEIKEACKLDEADNYTLATPAEKELYCKSLESAMEQIEDAIGTYDTLSARDKKKVDALNKKINGIYNKLGYNSAKVTQGGVRVGSSGASGTAVATSTLEEIIPAKGEIDTSKYGADTGKVLVTAVRKAAERDYIKTQASPELSKLYEDRDKVVGNFMKKYLLNDAEVNDLANNTFRVKRIDKYVAAGLIKN